ncbi:hypothetical protein AGOR_G00133900 [Albula goreensis]|uniref:Uncharacterized protein n=1 Tax=Albula goreensis TaxID=1534307 RepID=A0A8T3DD77_9TELE|nr:hypothetical protein AGOR_G00133900 [Albula goreensis]
MMGVPLLSWTLLFVASGAVLAHPITDSSELRYTGPALAEGSEALSQGELSHTSQTGTGQEFPSLLTEELDRDGLRAAGFIPLQDVKEVLLEKQGPLRRFLGSRKQYGKRGNPTECFWKYCV